MLTFFVADLQDTKVWMTCRPHRELVKAITKLKAGNDIVHLSLGRDQRAR